MDHSIQTVDALERIVARLQPCLVSHIFKSTPQGKRRAPAFQLESKNVMVGTQFLLIKVVNDQLPPSHIGMSFSEFFDSFLNSLLW
jgi:hypothetical protein